MTEGTDGQIRMVIERIQGQLGALQAYTGRVIRELGAYSRIGETAREVEGAQSNSAVVTSLLQQALEGAEEERKTRLAQLRELEGVLAEAISLTGTSVEELSGELDERLVVSMGFSVRTLNALRSRGIETVGQLLNHRRSDLLAIKNFGVGSFVEMREILRSNGCMIPQDWETSS